VVIFSIGLAIYLHVVEAFGINEELVFHSYEKCEKIKGILGAEDLEILNEDVFITTEDDRLGLWEIGTPNLKDGGIFVVSVSKKSLRKLDLVNFPKNLAFHPHGIFLYKGKEENLLYIINHSYKQGERIEVFQVEGKNYEDFSVTYLQSIVGLDDYLGTLNDLVVIAPGQVYVTQYRYFPDMPDGRDFNSKTLQGKLNGIGNSALAFAGFKKCTILYITHDRKKVTALGNVTVAAPMESMHNGITQLPNGKILSANPLGKEIYVYSRDVKTNRLQLESRIPTQFGVDNFFVNPTSKRILIGCVGRLIDFIKFTHLAQSTKKTPENVYIPGGASELLISEKNGKTQYSTRNLVLQDGKLLSGISVAGITGNNILIGSWHDEGILLCPTDK